MFYTRTKHIEIDFHFFYDLVASDALYVKFIPSRDQLVNTFTFLISSSVICEALSTFVNSRCDCEGL
jgi:hypothetical protein